MQILIVDDEVGARTSLEAFLKDDHDVIVCADGEAALAVLEKVAVDLVITDHQMPKLTGMDLIAKGKELSPRTAFILVTAYGSVDHAIEAIRRGADDYLMKPLDFSELEHRIKRVTDLRSWRVENEIKAEAGRGAARLIGKSNVAERAREFVSRVAGAPSPVLLLGPTGSGKEVLARAIHESGPRAERPFIAINCASLNEQLMESELFGHEKGAFTGATTSKPGKFELAKGGTLFLDEVGELAPGLQAKLLRVLQEKEFFRVGGVRQIKSDARVITATHRDLKAMAGQGSFREDLLFRLNVLSFELAPLRERPEDIPVLIDFFWRKLAGELCSTSRLSPGVVELLTRYAYPGNIRELQNVLERLMVLSAGGEVGPTALPPEFQHAAPPPDNVRKLTPVAGGASAALLPPGKSLTTYVEELEAELIAKAMEQAGQNQLKAAELLGINRGALQYKLKKYVKQAA